MYKQTLQQRKRELIEQYIQSAQSVGNFLSYHEAETRVKKEAKGWLIALPILCPVSAVTSVTLFIMCKGGLGYVFAAMCLLLCIASVIGLCRTVKDYKALRA
jgi:hypothetical protein